MNVQYSAKKNIRFKTPMLRSELCDYSNVYIVANDQTDHGALKLSATHYKQKTEIFLVTRQRTCWKPDSCFWSVKKKNKRIKVNLWMNL